MGGAPEGPKGPDLAAGIPLDDVHEGTPLLGHVHGEAVLLVRRGGDVLAVGATCTHYGGPLAEGLVVGDTIRCPWHHACFSLRTGEVLGAPALAPLPCWDVAAADGTVRVAGRREPTRPPRRSSPPAPEQIVIVGGGAAGHAAAETLRAEGYVGRLTIVGADDAPPVDRPNLSKDYLAGTAPEEWVPLRPPEAYQALGIELVLGTTVMELDAGARKLRLADGRARAYDALLLATGAEPVRLAIPGFDRPHVHTLRDLADCRAIIARAPHAVRAVVLGASFLGLEVAASLRARNIDVHVVAPEGRPLERALGAEVGDWLRAVHERHGVTFHLGTTAAAIEEREVVLATGERLAADLVVSCVGVTPRVALAERAGARVDRGVVVDELLRTTLPGVWAAGDVARWPDPHVGQLVRVEHWVVARQQGRVAARNMLGLEEPFRRPPFFWTTQHGATVAVVGHPEHRDQIVVDGSLAAGDARVEYVLGGRTVAVATVGRDLEALRFEAELERQVAAPPPAAVAGG